MKTVLFVPGFQENLTSRNYQAVLDIIRQSGYAVKFVPIEWRHTTVNGWVKSLISLYEEYDPNDTILAGFSLGAVTALVTASRRVPAELWLFSLSPYFSENRQLIPDEWLSSLGTRRIKALFSLSLMTLCKSAACSVKMYFGQEELEERKWSPAMESTFEQASHSFENCKAYIVSDAGHQIEDPNYLEAIKNSIK